MKKTIIAVLIISFAVVIAILAIRFTKKDRPNIVLNITNLGDSFFFDYYNDDFCQILNTENVAKQGMMFNNCYTTNTNSNAILMSILSGENKNDGRNYFSLLKGCVNDFANLFAGNDYQVILVGDWNKFNIKNNDSFLHSNNIKFLAGNKLVEGTEGGHFNRYSELKSHMNGLIHYLGGLKNSKPYLIVFYNDISNANDSFAKTAAWDDGLLMPGGYSTADSTIAQMNVRNQIMLSQAIDFNLDILTGYLKSVGKLSNTVFVFTTIKGISSGMKDDNFQKMSLSITFPAKVKAGSKSAVMCQSSDCLPTILDLVSIKKPVHITGKSLLPVIENNGDKTKNSREYVICNNKGNCNIKELNYNGILTADYKLLHRYNIDKWELYNLRNDPFAQNNIFYFNQYDNIKDSLIYLLKNANRSNL